MEIKRWARPEKLWVKRASAVSLIVPARRGKFLNDIFEIADILLPNRYDMVQKGYDWMFKDASKPYQKEVFDYVVSHRALMPRLHSGMPLRRCLATASHHVIRDACK